MLKLKIEFIVLALAIFILFISCNNNSDNYSSQRGVSNSDIKEGERLAKKYCQSCHQFPDPSLLDAKSWEEGVLPVMGPRLGIFSYDFKKYPSYRHDRDVPKNFYPSQSVLSSFEWQHIIDYYTAASPDSLPPQNRSKKIKEGLTTFKVQLPGYSYSSPGITLTKVDTASASRQLFLFDVTGRYIYRYNQQLTLTDSAKCNAAITDIAFYNDNMLACNTNILNPNNGKFGKAQFIHRNAKGKLSLDNAAIFDSLARPVQITGCDLNNDKKTDYLVCEFGHLMGALSWMENTGGSKYIRHVLRAEPGPIKAYVEDVNKDGLQDIWALFTQGEEGVFLFINKGDGKFDQQQVLRFPAIYGSTYFEFADFNNDGLKDIVYTCGDNADYSDVLKPYHGVYIFLNEGNNQFKQKYFFPINGCFKAMARDYDRDGDLDIAAIAFFADFGVQPEEGFVYLQNEGNFNFEPFTIPECKTGRWLTMDAADLDGDGATDIVLGNFSTRPSKIKPLVDWKKGPPFIFLKNISK